MKDLYIIIGENSWHIYTIPDRSYRAFEIDKNGVRVLVYNPDITESSEIALKLLNIMGTEITSELQKTLEGIDPTLSIQRGTTSRGE